MTTKQYLHWSEAGGPNECEHGYAEGIPCPNCDKIPLVVALRIENERLRTGLKEVLRHMPFDSDEYHIVVNALSRPAHSAW